MDDFQSFIWGINTIYLHGYHWSYTYARIWDAQRGGQTISWGHPRDLCVPLAGLKILSSLLVGCPIFTIYPLACRHKASRLEVYFCILEFSKYPHTYIYYIYQCIHITYVYVNNFWIFCCIFLGLLNFQYYKRKRFSFQFVWIQNVFEMETFILKITTASDYSSKRN